MEALAKRLLAWYEDHRCDLPWRRTRDPYHIYIHFRITLFLFHCRHKDGQPQVLDCADWRWVAVEDLPRFALPASWAKSSPLHGQLPRRQLGRFYKSQSLQTLGFMVQ
ncbi:MAG: hypothetical protein ACE5MB_00560 [Anaerolineae bacterium]